VKQGQSHIYVKGDGSSPEIIREDTPNKSISKNNLINFFGCWNTECGFNSQSVKGPNCTNKITHINSCSSIHSLDSSYSRSSIGDVLFLQRKLYMVIHMLNKSHQMRLHNRLTLLTEIPFGESSKSSKSDQIYYYLLLHCEQAEFF
jgi:hypothetical protein